MLGRPWTMCGVVFAGKGLGGSLERLVADYRGYSFGDDCERALILIDEVTRPIRIGSKR